MSNNIKILFWLYKARINKTGTAPLMVRINYKGQRVQFSTGQFIPLNKWDRLKGRVRGKDENAHLINSYIQNTANTIRGIFNEQLQKEDVNLLELLNQYTGKNESTATILQLITYHNEQMKAKLGGDYALPTLKKYQVTKNKLERFIQKVYNKKDMRLKDLQKKFIYDFDFYLKTEEQNAQNTAAKHCKNLKRIINLGISNGWLDKSPFDGFKTPYQVNEKVYLNKEELTVLEQKTFRVERLQVVKDMFVFQCYTGLAFSDMAMLTGQNINIGIDGGKWIIIHRRKTKVRSAIPLLLQALGIIEKYNKSYAEMPNMKLLPVYSNQKYNAYLHEIADLCGINKDLTSHAGRRTFATTIGLSNGVSIETISKILGHSSTKITHQYAIVTDLKISEEMKMIKDGM